MRDAEQVVFGGSGLDRAAGLRAGAAALACTPEARTLALWRGKLLLGPGGDLALLAPDHPLMAHLSPPAERLFLGRSAAGVPLFAADLPGWNPGEQDTATVGAFRDPSVQHHPAAGPELGFHELRTVMTALSPRAAELAATARALRLWHDTHGFCARCGARSDLAQGGWQRTCPACGAHHFPRTDPVVIMLVTHGNDVLLGRSPGWPAGMYSLLAGFVEPGETVEAAVRREVEEESGILVGAVGYLASQPWPFPASLMLGCRGEAQSREIRIDPAELEDAIWVSRERLLAVMAGEDDSLLPARPGAIAHFLLTRWLADRLG